VVPLHTVAGEPEPTPGVDTDAPASVRVLRERFSAP
jgi:hypothetical protein